MKKFLMFLILSLPVAGFAASTDTVKASTDTLEGTIEAIAADMAQFHKEFVAAHVPVEHKVIELRMTSGPIYPEFNKKRGRGAPLPYFRSGKCSGAFINDSGDILTAKHCVEGYEEFEVLTFDQRKYTATVVSTSTVHDLALLHIDRRNTAYFQLAETSNRGQTVFVLGSPLGITDALSTGVISKLDGDATLLDCSALPGNSGGPVFNTDDELVGVLNAGYIWGFGVTHLNRAVGLDAVHFFLKKALEKK